MTTAFLEFIGKYWNLIASIIVLIVSLILMIVRKKPNQVVDSVTYLISSLAPVLINQAEDLIGAGNGSKKMDYVVKSIQEALKSLLGITDDYSDLIKSIVESILSTPQKK